METMDFPRTPDSVIRSSIEAALRRLPDQGAANRHAIYARARKTIAEKSPEHLSVLEEIIADFEREYAPEGPEEPAGPEHDVPGAERLRRRWRKPGVASVLFAGAAVILVLATGVTAWWLYQAENAIPQASFASTPEGGYVLTAQDFPQGTMFVPEGLSVSREDAALRLSGNFEGASPGGRTGGVSFALPEEIERQVSGKTATITIVGTSEKQAAISAAYSTNEVGNSGWHRLDVGRDADGLSFTYRIPPAANYLGDFIGILPDPEETGNTFLLEAIRLEFE